VGAQKPADGVCRLAAARAAVPAHDQTPAGCDHLAQEALHESLLALLRHVDEFCPDEVEPDRRLPGQRVTQEDAARPPRSLLAGELDYCRSEVDSIRLDVVAGPARDAFHQVTVGASDVEERPVAVDLFDDRASCGFPASLIAAEARLVAASILTSWISRIEDLGHPSEPPVIVDHAPRSSRGNPPTVQSSGRSSPDSESSEAAAAAEVSERTARRRVRRYLEQGEAGVADRSSAPRSQPGATPADRIEAIAALRRVRMTGAEIAECLGMALSARP